MESNEHMGTWWTYIRCNTFQTSTQDLIFLYSCYLVLLWTPPPISFLSFSNVTLLPLIVSLCTRSCRQWRQVSRISSTLIRCSYCLPAEMKPGIVSWYAPPALLKWDVSPLCAPSNTGDFCVCEWKSWECCSESVLAWLASLHTNAEGCQGFIQRHSPT